MQITFLSKASCSTTMISALQSIHILAISSPLIPEQIPAEIPLNSEIIENYMDSELLPPHL